MEIYKYFLFRKSISCCPRSKNAWIYPRVQFETFIFSAYYTSLYYETQIILKLIYKLFMRYPVDIRVRAMQLRNHKFVTPAINGSSWITNTAPSPDLPMFSWISMRIRRFSEHSNFPGTSLRSVIEFYEMWRKIHFNIREREREREREKERERDHLVFGKNRIIRYSRYVMNYSRTRLIIIDRIYDLYFTDRRCVICSSS